MNPPSPLVGKRTIIVNAIIALAGLYPPALDFVKANPATILFVLSGVNTALRLVTKGKHTLWGTDD